MDTNANQVNNVFKRLTAALATNECLRQGCATGSSTNDRMMHYIALYNSEVELADARLSDASATYQAQLARAGSVYDDLRLRNSPHATSVYDEIHDSALDMYRLATFDRVSSLASAKEDLAANLSRLW